MFRQAQVLPDFIAACEADYRGRKGLQDREYPQGAFLQRAFEASSAVLARELDLSGLSGPEVGERLREARAEAIGSVHRG